MMMHENTVADVTARVKSLDIELVSERNIMQFNFTVQTNLTLCLIHQLDTKMIEEAMKLSYNKYPTCINFALTLNSEAYEKADISGKLSMTQTTYIEAYRSDQWTWRTARKPAKQKRQEPHDQIALTAWYHKIRARRANYLLIKKT